MEQPEEHICSQNIEVEDLDTDFTEEEIQNAISKMKAGKAAGGDTIPPEFIKEAGQKLIPYLKSMFDNIYSKGDFPLDWAKAIIVPIYKKGPANNPKNYRPISLLSIISKVFISILTQRLYRFAENRNLINLEQAGFRKGFSTVDHIYTLQQMISNCLFGNRRAKLFIAYIDYKQAFDSIKRHVLWETLERMEVSSKMIRMIQGIYRNVEGSVRYGAEESESFNCPIGLRQGCVLSPLLFSLLISSVATEINSRGKHGYQFLPGTPEVRNLMFADDLSLISTTPAGLQHSLQILEEISDRLGLTVNLEKTKVMVYRKGGFLAAREFWTYKGQRLDVVNSFKYLGYTLTTKLSKETALSEYIGKAKKKVFLLKQITQTLGYHAYSVYFRLFDAQIASGLLYGSEIWGAGDCQSGIEGAHMMACKKYLGVKINTPNCLVYGELARYPLYINSQMRVIKYWLRILDMDDTRLPKIAYNRELREDRKTKSWSQEVKNLLDNTGFSNVWHQQSANMVPGFLKSFKRRLMDIFIQDWHAKINSSIRCHTYKKFKTEFQVESYIENITIVKFKFAFARLRLGANALKINTNYTHQFPDTLCPFCQEEENELHFLTKCVTYKDLRDKYLSKYLREDRNRDLNYWLGTENVFLMRDVAMFVHHGLLMRQSIMTERGIPRP